MLMSKPSQRSPERKTRLCGAFGRKPCYSGGLHGEISRTRLFSEPLSSSHNSHLARLLEDVEIPRTNRSVCENRGSDLLAVARELRKAGLEPPDLADRISATTMTIRTAGYGVQPPRQPHPTGATPEPGRPIRVRATDSMPPSLSAGAATEPRARIRELLADALGSGGGFVIRVDWRRGGTLAP